MSNSVGVWAFGPAVTRFVPPGYHPEAADEGMVEKTKRVCEGLSDLLDGLEYHYPGEVNEENVEEILAVLEDHGMDLPVVPAGLHPFGLREIREKLDRLLGEGNGEALEALSRNLLECRNVNEAFEDPPAGRRP